MKKTFLLVVVCVLAATMSAEEHMKFKGIEMNGTVSQFVSQLQAKGMTRVGSRDGSVALNGDFASYKNCTIAVVGDEKMNVVKVAVVFPEQSTWGMLSSNYETLKDMLTTKYGEPSTIVEKWDGYSEPRDDNDRMLEVGMDRCKYGALWETPQGNIELMISHNDFTCFVMLSYYDEQNQSQALQSAIDDL